MVVATARIAIRIPYSHSLKDKRAVLRPIVALLQRQFRISAAEIEEQDRWQIAVVGVACVSGEVAQAESVIAHAVSFLEKYPMDAEVIDIRTETFHGC